MFNKRIKELQTRLDKMDELKPYMGLAQAIKDQWDQLSVSTDDVDDALSAAIAKVDDVEREKVLQQAYTELSSAGKAELLARVFGEEFTRTALQAQQEQYEQRNQQPLNIDRLLAITAPTGTLIMANVPYATTLHIGMLDDDCSDCLVTTLQTIDRYDPSRVLLTRPGAFDEAYAEGEAIHVGNPLEPDTSPSTISQFGNLHLYRLARSSALSELPQNIAYDTVGWVAIGGVNVFSGEKVKVKKAIENEW